MTLEPYRDSTSPPQEGSAPSSLYFSERKLWDECPEARSVLERLSRVRGRPTRRACWQETWREDASVVALEEGTRGDGADRGAVGVAEFPAGTYPACSRHGALIRVGVDPAIWRCLVHSCNAGAMTHGEETS